MEQLNHPALPSEVESLQKRLNQIPREMGGIYWASEKRPVPVEGHMDRADQRSGIEDEG